MNQRRGAIETLVNKEGTVSFSQLKLAFPDVSEMTLRSDLRALDEERRIVRVYGGARSLGNLVGTDDAFDVRASRNTEEKRQIVKKALKLLRPGMAVYLDSGSTAIHMASQFPDESYLVFTSGINCALELAKRKNVRSHLIGGEINHNSLSVNGMRSISDIGRLNFNMAFLGTSGFAEPAGFNCAVEAEAELKRAVMERSERVVVMMDSQKVGRLLPFTFAQPGEVQTVITDDKVLDETRELFFRAGTEML